MSRLVIEIPEQELEDLGWNLERAELEWRLAFAARLYKTGRYSAGGASERAGIPVVLFNERRGEFGLLTFEQTREELEAELAAFEATRDEH